MGGVRQYLIFPKESGIIQNMNRQWFLISCWIITGLSFVSVAIIWLTESLKTRGELAYLFFFFPLWLGISGILSYVGFLLREKLITQDKWPYFVNISFREGFLLGSAIVVLMILFYFHWFYWWNVLLSLSLPLVAEFYFLYKY